MRTKTPLALAAALLLLPLAGCAAGGQSVADACAIAEEKVTAAQADLSESMSAAASGDVEAANTLMESFSAALDEAQAEITNEEVSPVIATLAEDFDTVSSAITEMAEAGDDIEALTAISEEMTEVGERMQTTGMELNELCG